MLEVYDKNLIDIDIIPSYRYLMYEELFDEAGEFKMYCDITDRNLELLRINNFVQLENQTSAIIQQVEKIHDDTQNDVCICASGKTSEIILSNRIIWGQYLRRASITDLIIDLISQNLIFPSDEKRKIDYIDVVYPGFETPTVTYEQTGGSLYDEICNLCKTYGLGFKMFFSDYDNRLSFSLLQGTDRTVNQNIVEPIIFSSSDGDINSSSYLENTANLKNVALVAGAGEGTERNYMSVEKNNNLSGIDRKEIFVDARDLQKIDSSGNSISQSEYYNMLKTRAVQKFSENNLIKNFNVGDILSDRYYINFDFYIGDIVTVRDEQLNLETDLVVKGVRHTYDNSSFAANDLILGDLKPTLYDKIRRIK